MSCELGKCLLEIGSKWLIHIGLLENKIVHRPNSFRFWESSLIDVNGGVIDFSHTVDYSIFYSIDWCWPDAICLVTFYMSPSSSLYNSFQSLLFLSRSWIFAIALKQYHFYLDTTFSFIEDNKRKKERKC